VNSHSYINRDGEKIDMAFQTPLTIREVIENIHRKKYVLPAIQREFVWGTDQIERLFDSLMQGYPVGSFLFWHVVKSNSKNFQFYEFIRNYHEMKNHHNPAASIDGTEDLVAILDGQQRLTSMYIGLKGSYAYKMPRLRRNNPTAYPERFLYLDLLAPSEEFDFVYDFRFLTNDEASDENIQQVAHWFKVADILTFKEFMDVNTYLLEKNLLTLPLEQSGFANKTLFKLFEAINQTPSINYYLEKDQELEKVLNIFIRVNSGGTQLSYSDLLLSIATAQWKNKDARKEITAFVDEINQIGDGFFFNKDFVLKSCLVLCDFSDIAFKVDNFNANAMQKIENEWDNIKDSIRLAVELIASFGYSEDTLTSKNAVIPIAYYLRQIGIPKNYTLLNNFEGDRQLIKRWLSIALLKKTFGGAPDNVLRPLRRVIKENSNGFPLKIVVETFKGSTKTFTFDQDELNNLLTYNYGQSHTFAVLSMLYPTLDFRNKFHLDHIFAKSLFKKKELIKLGIQESQINLYSENVNCIANLQLLEGIPNIQKSNTGFEDWLNKTYLSPAEKAEYSKKHYIPNVSFKINDFPMFIEKREQILIKEFEKLLVF
jgi:uncharacterized protein with ParB-like and HNH nuclease domain